MCNTISATHRLGRRRPTASSRGEGGASRWTRAAQAVALLVVASLAACGGNSDDPSLAQQSQATVTGMSAGVSPFIELIHVQANALDKLDAVEFTIQPKPGSLSRPVHVTESHAWLTRQGHLSAGAQTLDIPVFGLYANMANSVTVQLHYSDASSMELELAVPTAAFVDTNGIYDKLQVLTPRTAALGFDYFVLKGTGTPVIVDTDGQIRWTGAASTDDASHAIADNGGFFIGSGKSLATEQLQLDGQSTTGAVVSPPSQTQTYTDFHHNVDPGKTGLLAEFDADRGGVDYMETILAEIDMGGQVLQSWDLGDILGRYMQSQGDDPTLFVRPGTDWFHMNASLYDPVDDSVVVSSRENFLIKLDYKSGEIKWIFGDPTKYWYTFPSLRAKALTLQSGLYPIGQHGISMVGDHELLLFNNGYASFRQPQGAPGGETRNYAAVDAYSIDENSRTVTQVWNFDHGQDIKSNICGDAAQATDGSVLIDYAYAQTAGSTTFQNRLIGLTPSHDVAFDFALPTKFCGTTFNAQLIHMEALTLR
jgi:arylsulfate sulfotransferase